MPLKYNGNNIPFAKILRKSMTRHEKHLWYDFLSKYSPRFQRQKPINNFIADFYCQKAGLVIEIDGSQHFTSEGLKKDAFRTEILEGVGLKIIRFSNYQIDTNFYGVCEYIDMVVKAIIKSLPLEEGGTAKP